MILFKYAAISDLFKKNLADSAIWFARPDTFNDIDDSNLRLNWRVTDEDLLRELEFSRQLIYECALANSDMSNTPIEQEREMEQHFSFMLKDRGPDGAPDHSGRMKIGMENALSNRRQNIGISCFSQDNLNRLLWAHYGDQYRGVCLEIETSFDKSCFQQLEMVQYVEHLPTVKLLGHLRHEIIKLYTTKGVEWAYEREVRAFQGAYGKYHMDSRCLRGIYLGIRVQQPTVDEIQNIVRATYGPQVCLRLMNRDEEGQVGFSSLSEL